MAQNYTFSKFYFSPCSRPAPDPIVYLSFWVYVIQFKVFHGRAGFTKLILKILSSTGSYPLSLILTLSFRIFVRHAPRV